MAKKRIRSNGEGSFYKSESRNCWIGQVCLGHKQDGSYKRITKYGKTKKEVQEKIQAEVNKYNNGTYVDKSKLTVHDVIELLINTDFNNNKISANSRKRRLETLKIVDNNILGALLVQKVTDIDINKFLLCIKNYSNSTISKCYTSVKQCFDYCKKKKIISDNPFVDGDIIKPKSNKQTKKISALTIDEQAKLIDVLNNEERNNKYRAQFLLMLNTGMRMGEINALSIDDVNFNFKMISIHRTVTRDANDKPILGDTTKTENGRRNIRMTNAVVDLLQQYLKNYYIPNSNYLLFYDNLNNKLYTTNQLNSQFKSIIEKYNIIPIRHEYKKLSEKGRNKIAFKKYTYFYEISNGFKAVGKEPADWINNFGNYYYNAMIPNKEFNLHMLRHTFATRCIEAGMSPKTLQKILGHSDIKITLDTYCDVFGKFESQEYDLLENYLNKNFNNDKNSIINDAG